ncbi:hypothetical protein B0J18DRAFT_259432 [Chaetomium sp. MPI-SDFR-AT-0129]|nr:hypothetical protein B0J18DRAFT_259432 [Chaetomium sp. MPI-SDFR-AT-0129]
MARTGLVAVLIIAILATFASATVQSFCKCTCFQNSTIIALGPQHDNGEPASPPPPAKSSLSSLSSSSSTLTSTSSSRHEPNPDPDHDTQQSQSPLPPQPLLTPREASTSCKQCNRAFCLKYNLPICKDAEDKDIKTTCFQRDSPKDRFIVWGFLLGTAGLLGWAALRRVWREIRWSGRITRREREHSGRI